MSATLLYDKISFKLLVSVCALVSKRKNFNASFALICLVEANFIRADISHGLYKHLGHEHSGHSGYSLLVNNPRILEENNIYPSTNPTTNDILNFNAVFHYSLYKYKK